MQQTFVYISSSFFAGAKSGIRVFRFDPSTGALEAVESVTQIDGPLYLEADPRKRCLFVVDCRSDWAAGGTVSAYRIESETGSLSPIGARPSCGVVPVHLDLSRDGRFLGVANCGPFSPGSGRTVAVLPVSEAGELGKAVCTRRHQGSSVDPERQDSPHPHALVFDSRNRFAVAPDLGSDRIVIYRFDPQTGELSAHGQVSAPAGSGPRHFRFHPDGRHAYLNTEIAGLVIAFAYDGEGGRLREIGAVRAVPDGYTEPANAAELMIHPSGRFLYCSNRGPCTLAGFAIDPESGRLTLIEHTPSDGEFPRAFAFDPSGRFLLLANEKSDTVHTHALDQDTGKLTPTGQVARVPAPACIQFVEV